MATEDAAGAPSLPGLFVSFEGIDGSGKSTQARLLAEALDGRGREVVLTREPGGSAGAEEIRRLVLTGDPDRWSPMTELLLFNASRRDHLERTILPALARGAVVVSDRFADSTRVYQGRGRGGPLREVADRIHALAIGREPDLTLVIDMDPARALARGLARRSGEDRFEEMGLRLQEEARAGFAALAREWPERVRVVDGDREPRAVAADVLSLVLARARA
jgi:dTMP kinase